MKMTCMKYCVGDWFNETLIKSFNSEKERINWLCKECKMNSNNEWYYGDIRIEFYEEF